MLPASPRPRGPSLPASRYTAPVVRHRAVDVSGTPRLAWAAGALLVVLLVALAVLQLRWLRAVAEADRQRLDAGVENALAAFADELDREVSRAWLTFHDPGGPAPERGDVAALRERWQRNAPYPQILADLVLITRDGAGEARFERLAGDGRWQPLASVPPALRDTPATTPPRQGPRERPPEGPPEGPPERRWVARRTGAPGSLLLRPELPGLVLPLATGLGPGDGPAATPTHELAILFDRAFLVEELLPALRERHLEPLLGPGLQMRVATRAGQTVWTSEPGLAGEFEWEVPLFDVLPPDELRRLLFGDRRLDAGPRPRLREMLGQRRERRHDAESEADEHGHGPHGPRQAGREGGWPWRQPAAWTLAVRPAAGSLDAALARAHAGNAALALGILLLLALAAAALAVSARRAQALARRQLEFTAAVSHELRTPLAAIRSLAENLADGLVRDGDRVRQYGAQIAGQGARLSAMVEQVLALAADRRGRQPSPHRPLDPAELIREVVDEAVTGTPEARVETDVEPLPQVVGDPSGLRHALGNLLGNALRHGGAPPWAAVRARHDAGRGEVRIAVSDRGPGVPEEDRERLFDPFFRGANAREGQTVGAGLGLHLAQRAAAEHQGRIELESAPGQGSTFTLVLPAGGAAG